MLILQKGFNYSQDGPGNRLVYHLQSCNFRCKWCSNPESMNTDNPEAKLMTAEEIVSEAVRSRPMFFDGGGVTFTGGEPTLRHGELLGVLKSLKEANIHTAIETNASDPELSELLPYIDYLITDLKHYDENEHKKYTGVKNSITKTNIAKIIKSKRQIHIRIPLINGINTDADGFVKFLSGFDLSSVTLEVLPYHEFGKDKWTLPYEITNGFVSDKQYNDFVNTLSLTGIRIIKT